MLRPLHLRVTSPFLAVQANTNAGRFITLSPGAIIETRDSTEDPGLVSIKLDGRDLFAFARDLNERSEPIEADAHAFIL